MFEYAKEVQEAYARLKAALQQEEAAKQHLKHARRRVTEMHKELADTIAKNALHGDTPGAFLHDLEATT